MGRATIVQNLGLPVANYSARYLIEFDLGTEKKAAALAKLNTALAENETQTGNILAALSALQATEDQLLNAFLAEENAYIVAVQAAGPGATLPSAKPLNDARQALQRHRIKTAPIRTRREALKAERARLLREVARWNTFQATETKPAWALNFANEVAGIPIGTQVYTLEIDGEQGFSFIGGSAVANTITPAAGNLVARDVMTPEQVFFNAAILPGWQRFKPTYRTGVIEALYFDIGRARVVLDPATSTPLALDINPPEPVIALAELALSADSYLPGDRVVVSFPEQRFDGPAVVVGWVDGPKRPAFDVVFSSGFLYQSDDGEAISATGNLLPPPELFPPPQPTQRVTRLKPTATFIFPDLGPYCVAIGSGELTVNYSDNFANFPASGPGTAGAAYYIFPRDNTDEAAVVVDLNGSVGYDAVNEVWGYLLTFYLRDDFFQSSSQYPKQYRNLGIDFIQEVPSTTYSASGFASVEAAYAAANALVIEIEVIARFQNGSECQLVCEKHRDGNPIAGFANTFRIKSCTPSRIADL